MAESTSVEALVTQALAWITLALGDGTGIEPHQKTRMEAAEKALGDALREMHGGTDA